MKDKVYPFYIDVFYKAFNDVDVIETWTEISHNEKGTVVLNQFASGYLPVAAAAQYGSRRSTAHGLTRHSWRKNRLSLA